MTRRRITAGFLSCYLISYLLILALAGRKDLHFGPYALTVWCASALVLLTLAAIPPALLFAAMRFRTASLKTVFIVWATAIVAAGSMLILYAR